MRAIQRLILLAVCIAASIVATAQLEQWKAYFDICGQFSTDMTPYEKMELYARMDSLFGGYIPVRQQEMNYMEAALQCGDTATFKRLAFRVVRWKGWNTLVFYYTDQYKFLKDCDWWPELDSIQRAIHGKKDYSYAETLYQMEQADQAARRAFNDPDHTHTKAVEDSLSRRMHEVDSVNLARLIWLMDTLGFPSWDMVCSYGARSAWLVAQHAHPWFQYGYVKQMRRAVADTNADPSNLAYLEDRLRTGRGLPQLYGTQFAARTTAQCGNAPSPTSRVSTCVAAKCLCHRWRTISRAI